MSDTQRDEPKVIGEAKVEFYEGWIVAEGVILDEVVREALRPKIDGFSITSEADMELLKEQKPEIYQEVRGDVS